MTGKEHINNLFVVYWSSVMFTCFLLCLHGWFYFCLFLSVMSPDVWFYFCYFFVLAGPNGLSEELLQQSITVLENKVRFIILSETSCTSFYSVIIT